MILLLNILLFIIIYLFCKNRSIPWKLYCSTQAKICHIKTKFLYSKIIICYLEPKIVNMKPNLITEIKMQVQRELGLAFCIYICSAIVYLICIL